MKMKIDLELSLESKQAEILGELVATLVQKEVTRQLALERNKVLKRYGVETA